MQSAPPLPWLPLRQELNLFPGPEDYQGGPTWVMQDPANQRFFRFDWPSLEMLRRWHLGDADKIADAISRDTTLTLNGDDVRAFQRKCGFTVVELVVAPAGTFVALRAIVVGVPFFGNLSTVHVFMAIHATCA